MNGSIIPEEHQAGEKMTEEKKEQFLPGKKHDVEPDKRSGVEPVKIEEHVSTHDAFPDPDVHPAPENPIHQKEPPLPTILGDSGEKRIEKEIS